MRKRFNVEELIEIELIGQGGFSHVYKVQNTTDQVINLFKYLLFLEILCKKAYDT